MPTVNVKPINKRTNKKSNNANLSLVASVHRRDNMKVQKANGSIVKASKVVKASKASKVVPVKEQTATPPSGECFVVLTGGKGVGGFNAKVSGANLLRVRDRYGLTIAKPLTAKVDKGNLALDKESGKTGRDTFEMWLASKGERLGVKTFKTLVVVPTTRKGDVGFVAKELAAQDKGHYRLRLFPSRKGWIASTRETSTVGGKCPESELVGHALTK